MSQIIFFSFSQFLKELNAAWEGCPCFRVVEAFVGSSAANHQEGRLFAYGHTMAVNLP